MTSAAGSIAWWNPDVDDANDVLREGLRLVEEKAAGDADKLQALRQAADLGFADLDQGRFNDVPVEKLADHIAG